MSSPGPQQHTRPSTPKWRSSLSTPKRQRPATSVSLVFAQPEQGARLGSAIDKLPAVALNDDAASFISEVSRKRERLNSNASSFMSHIEPRIDPTAPRRDDGEILRKRSRLNADACVDETSENPADHNDRMQLDVQGEYTPVCVSICVPRLSWLCIYARHPAEYLLHGIRPGRSGEHSLVKLDETVLQHDYTVILSGWLRAEGGRHVRPPHARGLRVAEEFSIDETWPARRSKGRACVMLAKNRHHVVHVAPECIVGQYFRSLHTDSPRIRTECLFTTPVGITVYMRSATLPSYQSG